MHILILTADYTVKPVLSGHSKKKINYHLMQVKSIAECSNRLQAKKGPAPPPLGNFEDISYLDENFKPHLLRDVCTLCSGALVSDSLLHMLL